MPDSDSSYYLGFAIRELSVVLNRIWKLNPLYWTFLRLERPVNNETFQYLQCFLVLFSFLFILIVLSFCFLLFLMFHIPYPNHQIVNDTLLLICTFCFVFDKNTLLLTCLLIMVSWSNLHWESFQMGYVCWFW